MLEGAKLIGAGAATIALAGAAIGIWKRLQFSDPCRRQKSIISKAIIRIRNFRICSNRSNCIVCPNDGLFNFIRFLINKISKKMMIIFIVKIFIFFFLLFLAHYFGLNPLRLLVVAGIVFFRRLGQILGLPWWLPTFCFTLLSAILVGAPVEIPAAQPVYHIQDLNLPPEDEELVPLAGGAPLINHQWAPLPEPIPPVAAPWHHGGPLNFQQENSLQLQQGRIEVIKYYAIFFLSQQNIPNLEIADVNAVVELTYDRIGVSTRQLFRVITDLAGATPERRIRQIVSAYWRYKNSVTGF